MFTTRSATADQQQQIVDVHGQKYVLREYIGAAPRRGRYVEGNEDNGNGDPQGFLVYQPPHSVTPPHFHETNQFQVFVDGDGKMGKREASPLSVHYAGGHTPYGPIAAGANGVRYFTLRQSWDPGAKYMPQMRERLVRGRQRHRLGQQIGLREPDALAAQPQAEELPIFTRDDDGLYAAMIRLGAGMSYETLDPADGGGQYFVVVNGALSALSLSDGGSEEFELWSCLYVKPDEPALTIQASEAGVELLLLQFPKLST